MRYTQVEFLPGYRVTVEHAATQMARDEGLFFAASALIREDGFRVPVFPRGGGDRWHLTSSAGTPQLTFGSQGEIYGG